MRDLSPRRGSDMKAPGQRPGGIEATSIRPALKGRDNAGSLQGRHRSQEFEHHVRPFQGTVFPCFPTPGRCPGLDLTAPSGRIQKRDSTAECFSPGLRRPVSRRANGRIPPITRPPRTLPFGGYPPPQQGGKFRVAIVATTRDVKARSGSSLPVSGPGGRTSPVQRSEPARGSCGARRRRVNQPDDGRHVVRTTWRPAHFGQPLSAVTGPVLTPNGLDDRVDGHRSRGSGRAVPVSIGLAIARNRVRDPISKLVGPPWVGRPAAGGDSGRSLDESRAGAPDTPLGFSRWNFSSASSRPSTYRSHGAMAAGTAPATPAFDSSNSAPSSSPGPPLP